MLVLRGNGGYLMLTENGDYFMRGAGWGCVMLREQGCYFMLRGSGGYSVLMGNSVYFNQREREWG